MNKSVKNPGFVFAKENYILLIAGVVLLIIGFLLMVGGGSEDPNVFSEELFNTRRLTIAPVTVLAGFVTVIFAITKRPKKTE